MVAGDYAIVCDGEILATACQYRSHKKVASYCRDHGEVGLRKAWPHPALFSLAHPVMASTDILPMRSPLTRHLAWRTFEMPKMTALCL